MNNKLNLDLPPSSMEGRYRIVAVNAETGAERLLAEWFPNLITDAGLDRFGAANWESHCQVGSGTNTPAVTDSALQSLVASTNTSQALTSGNSGTPSFYAFRQKTYRFAQGAAAGNLSEVGIGWAASGNLFSRARILDGGGNPTTITVLPTEFLDVTYELRLFPSLTDTSHSTVISGVTHTGTIRSASVGGWDSVPSSGVSASSSNFYIAFNGAIGGNTAGPTGTSSVATAVTTATYVNGSYSRDFIIDFGLNDGNLAGGISAMRIGSSGIPTTLHSGQISFSPAIAKDATKTLSVTFRKSWARRP